MFSIAVRTLCVLLWVVTAALGYGAWAVADWRRLIGQVALMLLAVVLWFAAPPGAAQLRAPTVGTRRLRIALYASVIVTAIVATSRWPLWFDDSGGSDSALILVFTLVVVIPFLQAERRGGPVS